MKISAAILSIFLTGFLLGCSSSSKENTVKEPSLKDALKDKFYIGTALNLNQIQGKDTLSLNIVKNQFNSIVAENCMKSMYLQSEEGKFFFDDADKFVKFGEDNNMLS